MPSKSHRAASRQARLRKSKRRGKGSAQVFDAGPTEAQIAARGDEAESKPAPATGRRPSAVGPAPGSQPLGKGMSPPAAARPTRRSRRAAGEGAALSYPYLGAELRRIGIVALLMFVILAAATFALSG